MAGKSLLSFRSLKRNVMQDERVQEIDLWDQKDQENIKRKNQSRWAAYVLLVWHSHIINRQEGK